MITVLSAHKRAITFLLVALCAFLLEVLQTAGKAFGRVVGCDSIDLGFSEEDTSRMRSSALCDRWYLRFSLSYRDLEALMAERNLSVDHTTVWRWVQRYAPELDRRARRIILARASSTWTVNPHIPTR